MSVMAQIGASVEAQRDTSLLLIRPLSRPPPSSPDPQASRGGTSRSSDMYGYPTRECFYGDPPLGVVGEAHAELIVEFVAVGLVGVGEEGHDVPEGLDEGTELGSGELAAGDN